MAIQGFDYKEFAKNLTAQAQELVPQEFNDLQKQYVVNTLLNFSTLAGEALYNDNELGFNADQAVMITQIIAEWSFHKSVDLVRSGLPQQFWDPIMQKIAFTIFEIAKQTFKQNMPQDQILQLIEHHVKKTYTEAIQELKDKNLIDENLADTASHQSNIDAMMQQMQQEQPQEELEQMANAQQLPQQQGGSSVENYSAAASTPKLLKLVTVALLFKNMKQDIVQTFLDRFNPDDASTVIKYMQTPDLEHKVDTASAMRCLQEFRSKIPRTRELTPAKIVKIIKSITESVERDQLEQLLKLERQKVKRFIFNALEGEYYEMPPKVANIIATHVQDSV